LLTHAHSWRSAGSAHTLELRPEGGDIRTMTRQFRKTKLTHRQPRLPPARPRQPTTSQPESASYRSSRTLSTHLAEIRLDPVVLDLLLGQSRPEFSLHLLLSQDQDNGTRGDALLGLFRDDFIVKFDVEFVLSLGNALGGAARRRRLVTAR
jgi:hypothetical protein